MPQMAMLPAQAALAAPLPDTPISDDTGQTRRLGDLRGTALVVNFWASWCAPCVHELPALAALDDALRGHGGGGAMAVALVGVDRKGREFARAFLDGLGIAIPFSFYDPGGRLARAMEVRVMPTSFMIGADGEIRRMVTGPAAWDSPAIIADVIAALA